MIKKKMREIAHWNRLLLQSIACFGSVLTQNETIWHGIDCKITFRDLCSIQFNVPINATTQYSVAKHFANDNVDGIVLKMSALPMSKSKNFVFDVSDFSNYPNEKQVLVYGDKLKFIDIVFDQISHSEYVCSLQLYQQIMRGRFLSNIAINKKNERRIIKMIENMMSTQSENESDSNLMDLDFGGFTNYIDPYIQSLFESMTRSVPKQTVWINKEMKQLLPELSHVFINDFMPYLEQKYFINVRYAHIQNWNILKKHLAMTQRTNPLKSACFDHVQIINNDNVQYRENVILSLEQFQQLKQPKDIKISFGFKCYKKHNMFKGEFVCNELPEKIESVKVLGGLWFEQIQFLKWDWCTFTNSKLSKGSSLFAINKINQNEQNIKIKICYQVKEVNFIKDLCLP